MRVWRGIRPLMQTVALMCVGAVLGSLFTLSLIPPSLEAPAPVIRALPLLKECPPCKCLTESGQLPIKTHNNVMRTNKLVPINNHTIPTSLSVKVKGQELVKRLSEQYTIFDQLTVAVFTSQEHLKMASTIYDTWGTLTNRIAFFVGDDCDVSIPMATGLPLVKVPGVSDEEPYSATKMFQVLQYLSSNYLLSSKWFLLAPDNVYVRLEKLETLLQGMDHSSLVYLGHSAKGRPEDSGKLSLLPHESYCLGNTGIVLSNGLLGALSAHLEACANGVMNGGSAGLGTWPDVELGKCISRTINTQCANSEEVRGYFVADYSGRAPSLDNMDSPQFSHLLSYHPASNPTILHTLHHHYSSLAFKTSLDSTHQLLDVATTACQDLSDLGTISQDKCTSPLCPTVKCASAETVGDPPRSYQPTGISDYIPWEYFNDRTWYNDKFILPSRKLQIKKQYRKELQVMLSKAVVSASESYGRQLKFKRLLNGWVRHNPFRGSEYIVDCLFSDVYMRTVTRRVSLVRPLASNYITLKDSPETLTTVNFVVPLSNVNDRFTEFMTMYEKIALESDRNVRLVLAVYGAEDVKFVENELKQYQDKYPGASFIVARGQGQFSRAKALHLGMTQLQSDELAFMCDIDMSVDASFIDRCRRNTIRGKRVYYPEFFKLYNLDYVYRDGKYPDKVGMDRKHGHWAYYSFGMLCIYKSDYLNVGGMNTNIVGWGEEDVKFFEKVVRKKLDVLRAPDTGLSHRWHEKVCSKNLPKTQYMHCLSSQSENLADRNELATYIFEKGVELRYAERGKPHNVQLTFPNDTTMDSADEQLSRL